MVGESLSLFKEQKIETVMITQHDQPKKLVENPFDKLITYLSFRYWVLQ